MQEIKSAQLAFSVHYSTVILTYLLTYLLTVSIFTGFSCTIFRDVAAVANYYSALIHLATSVSYRAHVYIFKERVALQSALTAKQDSQKMYAAAKQTEMEHSGRLAKIQSELQALHVKQKQLAEVQLTSMYRVRGKIK